MTIWRFLQLVKCFIKPLPKETKRTSLKSIQLHDTTPLNKFWLNWYEMPDN